MHTFFKRKVEMTKYGILTMITEACIIPTKYKPLTNAIGSIACTQGQNENCQLKKAIKYCLSLCEADSIAAKL